MRAVLLAGGAGTRLRPLTCDLPKPMVPVLGRPIAEHIIGLLRRHGITEIIVTLHYLPDVVRDYFQDGQDFGVHLRYVVEEGEALGTAGGVQQAAPLLTEPFLVISGDCITDIDLTAVIAQHRQRQGIATLVLSRVTNPRDFGAVVLDDQQRLLRFLEKPTPSEIFSDTVNTGIYILEPAVLEGIAAGRPQDFAQDVFPQLITQGMALYGHVAAGYWCDVGHLETYRQVHYDALGGRVGLETLGREWRPGIWVGEHTQIDATARIEAPALIGANCRVGAQAQISGGTVMGDNVTVAAAANLKRPIVLSGVSIGEGAELRGCVVDRNSRVGRRAHILEGAIIGAHCILGEESQVRPAVAIWPSKAVEAGAIVSTSLIWGQGATRHLFGLRGIGGLANIEITPEFAVRLGAAYGSLLSPGAQVVVSRDQRSISRMISRSLMAGLMSTGIHIQDLEATAIPIARYMVGHLAVVGGVHIRLDPERSDHLLIEFLDQHGINLPTAQEKKLEATYLREDLRRATVDGIGDIHTPGMAVAAYAEGFTRHLNGQAIRHSRAKVVIDYAYAVSGAVLPQLLAQFGCDALVLNASLRQNPPSAAERAKLLDQLGHVVTALEATLGVQVGANGEQLVVVDEQGRPAVGDELTALMAALMLRHQPGQTVVVPVTASGAVDQIAQTWGGRVVRTKANPAALMQACQEHRGVILGGSGDMGFIFPQLHPGFDGMFCIAKLIEVLTIQEDSLSQVRAQLPQVAYRVEQVSCPWRLRGAVLRYLVESHTSRGLDLVDGVRLYPDFPRRDRWVLVLPRASTPVLDIRVNGPDATWVNLQIEHYTHLIDTFLHMEITHEIGVDA